MRALSSEPVQDRELLVKIFTGSGTYEHPVMQSRVQHQIFDILNASGVRPEEQFRALDSGGDLGPKFHYREDKNGEGDDSVMIVISNGDDIRAKENRSYVPGSHVTFVDGKTGIGWGHGYANR